MCDKNCPKKKYLLKLGLQFAQRTTVVETVRSTKVSHFAWIVLNIMLFKLPRINVKVFIKITLFEKFYAFHI